MAAKLITSLFFILISFNSHAQNIYILAIGESTPSTCIEYIPKNTTGVYQINLNGDSQIASGFFEWSDCEKGSLWIPLGQKLISNGLADTVTFMPISVAGTSIEDWQQGGRAFDKLQKAIRIANEKSIKFDYAFLHQELSDLDKNPDKYENKLKQVLNFISLKLPIGKWIISGYKKCGNNYNKSTTKTLKSSYLNPLIRRFRGPNSTELGIEYKHNECQLNQKGQEKMASLWLESIISAENMDAAVQRETLLYYFKKI